MARQLPFLRGLAIIAVVCHHVAGLGYTAMFWWTHRYRPVTSPNFDQMGSPSFHGLLAVQQLALFSVPAFLFISGFFVAYSARGRSSSIWKMMWTRITNLLWPYLIWSVLIFVWNGLQGSVLSPAEYLCRLAFGRASDPFYFVPVLCQLYVLSPLISKLGKDRPVVLLTLAAAAQLSYIGLSYLRFFGLDEFTFVPRARWLFIHLVFYFSLGVVVGFRLKSVQKSLNRFRWVLLTMMVMLTMFSVLEGEWSSRSFAQDLDMETLAFAYRQSKISSSLYAVVFILTLLSFDVGKGRFSQWVSWIGKRSYGIFLMHFALMLLLGKVIYHISPWLLAWQLPLALVALVATIGISLIVMEAVARSPTRGTYRYLFG